MLELRDQVRDGRALLIGGKWLRGSGAPLTTVDPASGETNASFPTAAAAEVDLAVAVAVQAQRQAAWSALLPHQRADHLHAVSRLLLERTEPLARLVMHENGKTLTESRSQVRGAAGIFRYYAALCETLVSEVTPSRGPYLSLTQYEPQGVVAAITPWNSPVNLAAEKLAPALAAGNAVLLKPSELTPLVSLELGQLCLDAGVPPGIVNVLPGAVETASELVRHPGVQMISFTGGTKAGKAIAQAAAARFVPVVLELGGKSAQIVLEDADLALAAAGVVAGIFGSMGQSCIAGSRLLVHQSVHQPLLAMIVERARALRLGPPDSSETELGPLASFAHRDRVQAMVDEGVAAGARVLAGGGRPEGAAFARGAYFQPTVLAGLDGRASTVRNEIFGPVLCVLPFASDEEIVAAADDSDYGLACGIWTREFHRAWAVARRVRAGTVWINTYRQNSVATPFGGYKASGLGRERGVQGLRQYQQVKSVFLGASATPMSIDR